MTAIPVTPAMDPLVSLAFVLHSSPGVYALLLGSGLSRDAGIPTGWEIVLDLIRKVAALQGDNAGQDPEAWYRAKYEEEPSYCRLLETLAPRPAERSQILRAYFEPSGEDDERKPTSAHRAIAQMVKRGTTRVLLTTNFDRLMETALIDAGITPTVIRSPDDVEGALPLIHAQCVLVKLNGDYQDVRTLNTATELEHLDSRIDTLLDRILDEFGLIVCGWSADWDTALRAAIGRAKGRRFSTFWTKFTELSPSAEHLVQLRGAQVLPISGAEDFFMVLNDRLESFAAMQPTHPVTVATAVAQTKRLLASDSSRIRLHDSLMTEIEALVKWINEHVPQRVANNEATAQLIPVVDNKMAVAAAMIATGCWWGDAKHTSTWVDAINRLGNLDSSPQSSGFKPRLYPAVTLQYAAGIAAAAAGKMDTVLTILTKPRRRNSSVASYFAEDLTAFVPQDAFRACAGLEKRKVALSEHLFAALRGPLAALIRADDEYEHAFDLYETLQSIESAHRASRALAGSFMFRYYQLRGGKPTKYREGSPLLDIHDQLEQSGKSPVLDAGFCGGSGMNFEEAHKLVDALHESLQW